MKTKLILILAAVFAASSCTFTVGADGSKSGTLDGKSVVPIARAIIVATK
jgi:hypothetical protein